MVSDNVRFHTITLHVEIVRKNIHRWLSFTVVFFVFGGDGIRWRHRTSTRRRRHPTDNARWHLLMVLMVVLVLWVTASHFDGSRWHGFGSVITVRMMWVCVWVWMWVLIWVWVRMVVGWVHRSFHRRLLLPHWWIAVDGGTMQVRWRPLVNVMPMWVRTNVQRKRLTGVTNLRVALVMGGRGIHRRSAPVVSWWHVVRHIGLWEAVLSQRGHRRKGSDHVILFMNTCVNVPMGNYGNRPL